MKCTRILENIDETISIPNLDQNTFLSLLAKNKALLLRSDDPDNKPFTVDEFAKFLTSLNLEYYPYVGGAAPRRIIPVNVPGGDNMV